MPKYTNKFTKKEIEKIAKLLIKANKEIEESDKKPFDFEPNASFRFKMYEIQDMSDLKYFVRLNEDMEDKFENLLEENTQIFVITQDFDCANTNVIFKRKSKYYLFSCDIEYISEILKFDKFEDFYSELRDIISEEVFSITHLL